MKTENRQPADQEVDTLSTTVGDKETSTLDSKIPERPPDDKTKPVEAIEAEYEYITGVKLWLVIASITLICFLMMLDMSIVVTAIPRITSDFHSLSDVGWYGSAYLLANCAIQPMTGKVYSNFGSKNTFLFFLAFFEAGSVLCGAAQSSKMLIIGRAVAGIGGSGLTNGALTIIGAAAPMHKRPALMGVVMGVGQFGVVGGPLIGGALTQYATWRWCFYINLPIGAVSAIFLLLIHIPDRLEKTKADKVTILSTLSKLDLLGFLFFAPFAIMFLMALEWGGVDYPWKSATIIGLFCGSGGMLIIFAAWEYRVGDEAMIPYSMLRQRIVWSSCLMIGFFFGSLLIFSYYLPIYFQAVKGVSPALSGVYVLPGILAQMMMAVVSGVLVGKLGYYLPWIVASGAIIAIASGLISTFTPHTSTGTWVGYQFLAGFGRGSGFQMPIVAIQAVLPPNQIPVGMSLVVFCQTFGGSIFLTLAQSIFNQGLLDGLERYAPNVNAETVVSAGATAFRQVVTPDQLPGVLEAYNVAINHDFYLAAGASVAVFITCWGMGWRNIKKKKVVAPEV